MLSRKEALGERGAVVRDQLGLKGHLNTYLWVCQAQDAGSSPDQHSLMRAAT